MKLGFNSHTMAYGVKLLRVLRAYYRSTVVMFVQNTWPQKQLDVYFLFIIYKVLGNEYSESSLLYCMSFDIWSLT